MSTITLDDVKSAIDAGNAQIDTLKSEHERRLAQLETVLNRMATTGMPTAGAAAELRFPSSTELRQLETRAMSVGTDPAGGYLVENMVGPFFDRLRPQNVILAAGPVMVDMDAYGMKLPRVVASTTVRTPGEQDTITDSDLQLTAGLAPAKKYAVRTIASSELLADSNPGARELIAQDHVRQLANRLDLDCLAASTGPIVGLREAGTATALGSGDGATLTLAAIEAMLYRLEAADADMSRVAIFLSPRSLHTLRKELDGQNRRQLQPDPSADARRQLFGQPVYVSSQIVNTETVGNSSDCSYVLAADMSRVVMGRRQEVGVLFDPYSRSSTDQVVIQTITRWAFALVIPEACEVLTGVRG